jgi:hypothetical protein
LSAGRNQQPPEGSAATLVLIFQRGRRRNGATIALLASSSGRFKSAVDAIKAEAITELAAAECGLPVVKVTAASLKKVLGCATADKWQACAAERFYSTGRQVVEPLALRNAVTSRRHRRRPKIRHCYCSC